MTVEELIEHLNQYPAHYDVILEIDDCIDDCITVYSDCDNEIIIGGNQ